MINKTLYIGPYVKCTIASKFEPDTQLQCPNTQCERFGTVATSKFCCHCGRKIEEVQIGRKLIRPENNEGELEDVFNEYSGESSRIVNLVPNHDGVIDRQVFYDFDNLQSYVILESVDRALIVRETTALTLKYNKYLKLLTTLYETVEIQWGILCSVS